MPLSADLPTPPRPRADAQADAQAAALVVDDDAAVRAILVRMLRLLGYPVLSAAGGPEALEAAARHPGPLRLVVTDLDMPGMTGSEVARALAAVRPDTPVLFVSGRPAPRELSEAVVGRPAAFLAKPFTLDGLRSAVADLVGLPAVAAGRRRSSGGDHAPARARRA
jgi:CheY-like chemotaxis protein